jgi:hypothetical protein
MTAKTASAHSSYAGLLPIEPSDDCFRPIDLKPEPINLKPKDVPFPNWHPSASKRPRSLARFLITFCAGVATTLLWQSYGDAARERIANLYPRLGWVAPRPALTAQNPLAADVITLAASAAPPAEQPNAMSFDFDMVGQNVEKIDTPPAAGQEPRTRSADQMATGQEQMIRDADQTATSVDQNLAAEASRVAVAASLQPAARLTEDRPPQITAEEGRPRSAKSGHDGCFASASAVLQNHPGGWPNWTLRAPGHVGTMCWYAAARPRGSDHRRERIPKEKETVRTAEHELFAPVTPYGRGGSWEGGLPY